MYYSGTSQLSYISALGSLAASWSGSKVEYTEFERAITVISMLKESMKMSVSVPTEDGWKRFEQYARQYFSHLWGVDLRERTVRISDQVPWKFDLVSQDGRYIGDAKWLKNIKVPAAKWQAIAEYVWLLQKVEADKVFMVFGQDPEVAERFLKRVRPLTHPVEFYFLDGSGHRQL